MSMTMAGIFVSALGFLFQKMGMTIGTEDLTTFVTVGAQIVGLLVAYFGRKRQGDVSALGFKQGDVSALGFKK